MPTRRVMELIVIVNVLFWPAKGTVKLWCRKNLQQYEPGSVMHGIGEIGVTLL
jgi:hypothetical protein